MKISGIELQEFINTGWPKPIDDWYWDHTAFEYDPEPDKTYDTDDIGPLLYQGPEVRTRQNDSIDLAAAIRKWRKERDSDVFAVTISKAKSEELKKLVKELGGTIK